jgi:hypothetical protein
MHVKKSVRKCRRCCSFFGTEDRLRVHLLTKHGIVRKADAHLAASHQEAAPVMADTPGVRHEGSSFSDPDLPRLEGKDRSTTEKEDDDDTLEEGELADGPSGM